MEWTASTVIARLLKANVIQAVHAMQCTVQGLADMLHVLQTVHSNIFCFGPFPLVLIQEDDRSHSPDIHFEPVMKLPLIDVKTLEEDEEVLVKLRGKLYRYVTAPNEAPEWKERGTGEVKILCNKAGHCRILMRRDKTFKVCANHYVHPGMELKPSHGSDKAWVWSTLADFADEEPKPELLALRFGSVESECLFDCLQLLMLLIGSF
ncbi:hypothetical protein HPB51_009087 [Rhipicephalus microplus]|uniref:Ran-specific GTPase-activating protein n=1 Tax=Rhipicephalus microplus TaxID=6941 RepID=A0A9J6F040_RHIMP|nr:hypothetical protein HPB51_009087 [Rhipicephalus microplus]